MRWDEAGRSYARRVRRGDARRVNSGELKKKPTLFATFSQRLLQMLTRAPLPISSLRISPLSPEFRCSLPPHLAIKSSSISSPPSLLLDALHKTRFQSDPAVHCLAGKSRSHSIAYAH
ncbi:hypothetical protein ACLB2K_046973 [Fragaria x ananassa]